VLLAGPYAIPITNVTEITNSYPKFCDRCSKLVRSSWRQSWLLEQLDVLETARNDLLAIYARYMVLTLISIVSLPVKSYRTATLINPGLVTLTDFLNYSEFHHCICRLVSKSRNPVLLFTGIGLANDGARVCVCVWSNVQILITPAFKLRLSVLFTNDWLQEE